ncbi:sphingomyelin phosphodiesterase [Leptospira borgpetersenii]|uniref:sphingomyelin phosphodiesterase n=1 Tax=Leptospira borgpetersenii TaxID=174 RepID=UPI000E56C0C6|nr:sphingomyelin phosphodiesterase [Leptospira borgpetersenii serovar Ceylonica]QVK47123.1 sphingomyelin phosphodiesterase [Leptospira borgpetersenii]QVK51514.1 sphingomyelin phosphodiesterase [Leptospira borgpetersenii]QVK54701.1 sphingomyelin phosphodiesterase [Leptospira borgpetersenii]QVK57894.1 sphingomyelin phosphodiesterase [Leptospira borgpetersenii]
MKTKRNVFPEKVRKESKRHTNSRLLICCSLFLFFTSRCLPDKQNSYADLFKFLLLISNNRSVSNESQSSTGYDPINSDPASSTSPAGPGDLDPANSDLANSSSVNSDLANSSSVNSGSASSSSANSDSTSSSSVNSDSASSSSANSDSTSSSSVNSGSTSPPSRPTSSGSTSPPSRPTSSGSTSPPSRPTSSGSTSSPSRPTSSGSTSPPSRPAGSGTGSITSIEIIHGPTQPASTGTGSITIIETISPVRVPSGSRRVRSASQNVEIKILSHNVSLMSTQLPAWTDWGQKERAEQIANSDYIKNQDVIVFEGLSDTNARKILLDGIHSQYPYQTEAVGSTRNGWNATLGVYRQSTSADGGVVIVSQWPIEEKVQYIFDNPGCGVESSYHKGFTYVRINKNGKKFHVIGTQVQTVGPACSDLGRSVRMNQFNNIKDFINTKAIPGDELVLIAGDLNVTRGSDEYYGMLTSLNVSEPKYAGIPYTQDPQVNALTALRHRDSQPTYTNYVLVSKSHSQPEVWQNLAYDPISPKIWKRSNGHISYEFSDSYPVYGFVYADDTTPTKSGHRRKYDQVSLVSVNTGKRIQADSRKPNGWLKADATTETKFTQFNLVQPSDPNSNPFCMESGYVRVEPSAYLNYFWNWWYSGGFSGGNGNYGYYPKFDDGSNRLQIINLDGGCIQDGSQIAFKDYNTVLAKHQYLTIWRNGAWSQYLFLWSNGVVRETTFYLRLNSTPVRDWRSDLIYR